MKNEPDLYNVAVWTDADKDPFPCVFRYLADNVGHALEQYLDDPIIDLDDWMVTKITVIREKKDRGNSF